MEQRIDLTKGFIELDHEDRLRPYLERLRALRIALPALSREFGQFEDIAPLATDAIGAHLSKWGASLEAITMKYLMSARVAGESGFLTIDRAFSGLPVWQEMVTLGQDQEAAAERLSVMRGVEEIRSSMVRTMLRDQISPAAQQHAMSQRLFREAIAGVDIMLTRSRLGFQVLDERNGRRTYLVDWSIIDIQTNQPIIYMMEVEDGASRPLSPDDPRIAKLRALIFGQSMAGNGILDLIMSIDNGIDDLHPKALRRISVGPFLSPTLTVSDDRMQGLLRDNFPVSETEWAMRISIERISSIRSYRTGGFFGSVERQEYNPAATRRDGWLMTSGIFQAMCEYSTDNSWSGIRKYVLGAAGRLTAHA